MHWRRKWQPTPVFLPGESQGWGAWWAAVYGVTRSQTRLKRLSSSGTPCWQLGEFRILDRNHFPSEMKILLHCLLASSVSDLFSFLELCSVFLSPGFWNIPIIYASFSQSGHCMGPFNLKKHTPVLSFSLMICSSPFSLLSFWNSFYSEVYTS